MGEPPLLFWFFFFLRQSLPPENWDRGHRPQSCVRSGVFLIRRVGVNDPGDESHFLFPSSAGYWKKRLKGVFLLSLQGPLFEYWLWIDWLYIMNGVGFQIEVKHKSDLQSNAEAPDRSNKTWAMTAFSRLNTTGKWSNAWGLKNDSIVTGPWVISQTWLRCAEIPVLVQWWPDPRPPHRCTGGMLDHTSVLVQSS